jgi:hypothetical protein
MRAIWFVLFILNIVFGMLMVAGFISTGDLSYLMIACLNVLGACLGAQGAFYR